eukprot:scaffold4354_cov212-Skeletonema_marinoi.AAC.1
MIITPNVDLKTLKVGALTDYDVAGLQSVIESRHQSETTTSTSTCCKGCDALHVNSNFPCGLTQTQVGKRELT